MPPSFEPWAESAAAPPTASQNKKPRHRHSPIQLAALNELFDQNEHPPLDQRTALADRLGMETKTVNAWFQNKRASSKKRVRGGPAAVNAPPLPSAESHPNSHPQPQSQLQHHPHQPDQHPHSPVDFSRPSDMDDYHDDDGLYLDIHHSRSGSVVPSDYPSGYYAAANPEHSHFYHDSDSTHRRMRMRPSSDQAEELRKLYNINPHPTAEQRQALSATIGMRYQSITNWFQNQRSLAKKRKDDEPEVPHHTPEEYAHDPRQYSAFPPASRSHPSFTDFPPHPSHPSLGPLPSQRSSSVSPSTEESSPRRSSSHRSSTPYGSLSRTFSRPRRSRPEPYQLDALKELFTKSATPTIEERSALALEIGMDVGKVTNWFRNLRQTARKRTKKSGSGDDEDDDGFMYSASASRFGTPSFGSSSSSMNDDAMDMDDYDHDMHAAHHSENGSEDEYQEAVTPSPDVSPSPAPVPVETTSNENRSKLQETLNLPYPVHVDKVPTKQFSGIRVEDALLLLSFHHHVVH